MKKFLPVLLFLFSVLGAGSQQLAQITFANATTLSWFSFSTDQGILIRVSDDGRIMEWGTELASDRAPNYYAPKLQPYLGRVTYYGSEGDSMSQGKIKSIGTCNMTYYGGYELEEKRGRLKTIGRLTLDYFSRFENPAMKGRLRVIGPMNLDYYSQFENESVKGKLKSIDGTLIVYHSFFDDKMLQGKIKSIGQVSLDWGASTDIRYAGALKSGQYRQMVNGIVYILR